MNEIPSSMFILIFVISAIYAGFNAFRFLRALRGPRDYAGVTFAWCERPLAGPKYYSIGWSVYAAPWIAIAALGIVALIQVPALTSPLPIIWSQAPHLPVMYALLLGLSMLLTGFMWGRSTFFPIVSALAGKSFCATTNEGVISAGLLLPWDCFSHFSHDPGEGFIQLWSAQSPGIVCLALSPLSPQDSTNLVAVLRPNLIDHQPTSGQPRKKLTFPATVVMISLVATIIGFALVSYLGWFGLATNTFLLIIFSLMVGRLTLQSLFGGKDHPAEVQSAAAAQLGEDSDDVQDG